MTGTVLNCIVRLKEGVDSFKLVTKLGIITLCRAIIVQRIVYQRVSAGKTITVQTANKVQVAFASNTNPMKDISNISNISSPCTVKAFPEAGPQMQFLTHNH